VLLLTVARLNGPTNIYTYLFGFVPIYCQILIVAIAFYFNVRCKTCTIFDLLVVIDSQCLRKRAPNGNIEDAVKIDLIIRVLYVLNEVTKL